MLLHPLEQLRFAAYSEQGTALLRVLQRTVHITDLTQVPPVQWETAAIASGNCVRTYIFLFQPVRLFVKGMHDVVVSPLISFGPHVLMI